MQMTSKFTPAETISLVEIKILFTDYCSLLLGQKGRIKQGRKMAQHNPKPALK